MAYSCLVPLASVKIQLNRFMLILFCRVTLCVSAEPPIVRCPSVCLSVCHTGVLCIISRCLKIPSNFFLGLVETTSQKRYKIDT